MFNTMRFIAWSACTPYILIIIKNYCPHRFHHVKFALLATVVRMWPTPHYRVNQESGHPSVIAL